MWFMLPWSQISNDWKIEAVHIAKNCSVYIIDGDKSVIDLVKGKKSFHYEWVTTLDFQIVLLLFIAILSDNNIINSIYLKI